MARGRLSRVTLQKTQIRRRPLKTADVAGARACSPARGLPAVTDSAGTSAAAADRRLCEGLGEPPVLWSRSPCHTRETHVSREPQTVTNPAGLGGKGQREDEERPCPPPQTPTKPQQTRATFSLKKKGCDPGGGGGAVTEGQRLGPRRVPPRPCGLLLRFARLDFK